MNLVGGSRRPGDRRTNRVCPLESTEDRGALRTLRLRIGAEAPVRAGGQTPLLPKAVERKLGVAVTKLARAPERSIVIFEKHMAGVLGNDERVG